MFADTGDPNFNNSDLHRFDVQFGIPDPPNFTKVDQNGGTNYPGLDPAGKAAGEEALDVEWAHALAPQANILLVEANDIFSNNLSTAVDFARRQPSVSVVSMSFGGPPNGWDDSLFTTPNNHQGVTFLASTGDSGAPGSYPALFDNVVAVGGTNLNLNPDNTRASEDGWSLSGGGLNPNISEPFWQDNAQNSGQRAIPDVAFHADWDNGVAVLDSLTNGSNTPWRSMGGTSLSAPCWAALIAITNQARADAGMGALDGPTDTLPRLYALPSCDFHDITTGDNGFAAGPGYDMVTGLGTPLANMLVPDLAEVPAEFNFVAPQGGSPNNMLLELDPGHSVLELFNNGTLVECKALANTTDVHIIGADNTDDTLTINYGGAGNFSPLVTFDGGTGTNSLIVSDSANPDPETVTVTDHSISASGVLATWAVNYNRNSLASLSITIGEADSSVDIASTSVKTHVETGDGQDTINIGDGSVQGIRGDISVENTQFADTPNVLYVDDATDNHARNATVDTYAPSPQDSDWGRITGLTPFATISYENVDFSSVHITTGSRNDTVNVQSINVPTIIDGWAGHDTVNVGLSGSTEFIQSPLWVENSHSLTKVIVDDSNENANQTLFLGKVFGTTFGTIAGLSPAPINYQYGQTSYVTVKLGTGHVDTNVAAIGAYTTLDLGGSAGTVHAGSGGSMQDIAATLLIDRQTPVPADGSYLLLDDSADGVARNITIRNHPSVKPGVAPYDTVAGMAPGQVRYTDSALTEVSLRTGSQDDTVRVQSNGLWTTLDSGGGQDSIRVGYSGSVQGILGNLVVLNRAGQSTLKIDDSTDSIDRSVTLDTYIFPINDPRGSIVGLAPAEIDYDYVGTSNLSITTGPATVGINVLATGVPTTLYTMHSTAAIEVGNFGRVDNILGDLTIANGRFPQSLVSTLTVDDSADTNPDVFALSSSFGHWGIITGLAPATISFQSTAIATVTIDCGNFGNFINVQSTVSGPTITLNSGDQGDTILVGAPQYIRGSIALNAGGGTDVLIVSDQGATAAITYGINATTLTRTGSAAVSFDGTLENVSVTGGNHGNMFDVAPSPATTFYVNGGAKGDTLNVDLTGVTVPDLQFDTPASGRWVFGNAQPIHFTNMAHVAPPDALPYLEDFSDGIADHFIPWEGTWTPTGGHYDATPALGGDAVSTLLLNSPLPAGLIFGAALSMSPAAGGFDSNGFLIFDYHGPTDFKYAGARQSTGQWVIGQRTATGWHDLAVSNEPIAADTYYSMNLLIAGNEATLEVGGSVKTSFTFANPLNTGSIGLGTENSISQFAVVHVQAPS
jgi:hypothetical protein